MSEADMSMISDEDVLRRMWQQTEDFTRKKEIRAHMYRLREERLRNLYSPEPSIGGKDLKELSNAGWNVESENKITDNGHTHIKSVQANIEGKYDVEGGQGQFAAIEQKSQAASEYHDDNTSVIKNQSAQNSAAHEEIVRQSNDGTSFSSSSTSKTSSSQFQKSSTFKQTANHTVVTQNENVKKNQNTVDNNFVEAELLSRTVKYTDDDIKVTTEVRALPDGTRVTSTQRESKRPDSHNSKLEQYSEICATIKNNSSTKTSSETIKKSANINKETNRQELVEKESESHLRSHHKNIQAQETIQKNNSFTSSDRKIENHTNESNNTENRKHLNKNINKTEITKHKNNDEYSSNITENNNTNDRHQTTYQNDYTQKRISTDLSPTHQAWASTLRSDSPSIRTSIKLSLGESNTTSYTSIRSSISPEKNYMKPSSRENSPTKVVRDYGRSSKSTAKHTDTKITNIIRTGRTEKSPTRDPEVNLKNKPAHLENNNTNKYNKPARSPSISPSRNFPRSDEKSTEPRFSVSPQRKINQNEKIVHEGNENFVTVETTDINKNSRSVLRNSRSPSPPKGPVTFHDEIDNCKTNEMFKENSKSKNVSTKQVVDYKNIVNRSERKDIENKNENLESTKINKKNRTPSPTKRSSISPNKDKHKPTSDFISTEKSTEILNMTSKTHPRKLTTPSTSPTRLSELDYQPSTGLSSPTESVSDIVYISSLPEYHSSSTEIYESTKDVTGSLINRDNTAKRPNNLNIERSPSPTKIPSLIRTTPTTPNKESLPRKSSLKKKPSSDSVSSPIDKPNVQISPTVDSNDLVEHKIIKKDNPDKTIEGKIKPPLERRETYEERCKKILGMIDDNKIEENSQNIKTDSYDLIDKESHNKHEQQSLQEIYNVEKITRGDILETKKEPEFLSKAIKSTIKTSDFIMTEKEQEILNKVQNSLRKLSPERQPSPKLSKNNNPNKLTTSLQDIDIKPTSEDKTSQNKESFVIKSNKTKTKTIDRSEETSGTKSQSVSTKKMSYEEDSSKNKNILNTQKYIIPTKKEKSNNDKKENLSKQNSTSKITNSHKVLPQTNIIDSDSKSTKNTSIKDAKVTRTASDILIKASKYPAQRNNSKPEINVNKKVKQTSTIKVDLKKAHHYKSSVNTENLNKTSTAATKTDEINVTIDDSEHAKSSRENSPDRICPTPVNIIDDLNTPRLPDNIMEPDEEFRKRTHQTIHETGSSGNIVEIIEEEDIISKTKKSRETSYNTLSTKKDKINKLTDTSKSFKDTEKNVHSDFSDANIKNDDSLLTVSEKVSKFTSKNIKNEVEPVVKINPSDDYDIETIYQDDHTKLSVNDKAIYFKETAENINVPKTKPVHKVERPDLSDVEESLKTDECLLSVSAKVNKFVKTAEQYLNESTVVDDKEQKIKEQHDKIMELVKSINVDTETDDIKDQSTKKVETHFDKLGSYAKETTSSHAKNIDVASPNLKTNEIKLVPKIPSSLKSETVKKTKALFENITSTENIKNIKSTNLNEINAVKKSPKTDSTTVLHPSVEDVTKNIDLSENLIKNEIKAQEKTEKRSTITTKSHKEQAKPFISKYPIKKPEPKINIADNSSPSPAKANINKSDNETEVIEVSTRRGSGKFGVELRRTSLEKSMTTSERRRSSTEHHQPCIEDIYDLDLLEQMLESVVGYEQRRRIRAQIRVAKKKTDSTPVINTNTYTKSVKSIINSKSPDRVVKQSVKPTLIDNKPGKDTPNGHSNGIAIDINKSHTHTKKDTTKASSPTRLSKRTPSPSIIQNQNKTNRFQEYANAYKKKVGIDRTDETVTETSYVSNEKVESKKQQSETTKTLVQKKSKENIKVQTEKRASSPEKRVKSTLANGKHPRSPSPDIKKIVPHNQSKDVTTLRDIDDTSKTNVDEKPSWLTSRNLKKTSMESRNFSKKVEMEKKYRGTSPSKAIVKPTDVITSSYGVGPVDAEGKPLFGIKALRNGASNYQVRGTMVREEYHSHNGSSPEGTISITTYSNNPEDLEKLLKSRVQPPSRLHGLAAITTTKKFGGDTGNDYKDVRTKEERTTLDQFVHNDRKMESASHDLSSSNVRESKISKEREDFIKSERRSCEKTEERKSESREEKKTVRQNSVKSLTEKYIKSASDTKTKTDRGYPKAGLILRTGTSSSNIKENIDLSLSKSDHDIGSYDDDGETYTETLIKKETTDNGTRETKTTKTVKSYSTSKEEKSFLDSSTKVTGVQDILTRMKNADIVIEDGDSNEDAEARALLNKFLGATVLMTGMKNYIVEEQHSKPKQEQIRKTVTTKSSSTSKNTSKSQNIDLEECWDERILRKLLEESTDYEQRRRIRARLRTLMAEQEACASAVTEALAAAAEEEVSNEVAGESREEKVTTVTLSATKDSSEKSESSTTTTTTSKVIESMTKPAPKPVSPFAKFRQLEKQNSLNSPNSPQTPQSPGSPGQPYFKFTDPVLQASAVTIKERLLQWCRDKTRDYENVKLENFSTSWADGLAFCALIHHFLPEAFDYTTLTSDKRRHNFTLAFKIADEKAGIYPLLDVEDMVTMRKPDWKCVFTYVQAIHRRFKDQD